jgi:hypothetical protein
MSSVALWALGEQALWKRPGSTAVLVRVVVACVIAGIYYGVP